MTSVNSFIEQPRFPDDISYGASAGGPAFATKVVVYGSGREQRNPNWPVARHKYDAAHGMESQEQLNQLVKWFHITQGRAYGFRFKDWADYEASSATNVSGTGQCNSGAVGDGTPHYFLYKKYGPLSGGGASGPYGLRRITKPVSGTVIGYRNGSALSIQTTPGQLSATDTTTGALTFVADITRNITSISNAANGIVTLAASANYVNSSIVWIDGVAGMTQVNSTTHYINSVIDSTHFTLGTDTRTANGYGVYVSSGLAKKYPQPADTLTAEFQFDVPARFDTDEMHTSLDAPGTYSWGQIPILEIKLG